MNADSIIKKVLEGRLPKTKVYLISYDLVGEEKDYKKLFKALNELGAETILKSQWVVKSSKTAIQLRDLLMESVGDDDRILVNRLTFQWASFNALVNIDDFHRSG